MKSILCMQISTKVSYKLILWFFVGIFKHSQSSQNSKFVMSLQYLKKDVRDEVEFLHADKHQSFLQVNFNTMDIKVSYQVIMSSLMDMIKHLTKVTTLHYIISFVHCLFGTRVWQICCTYHIYLFCLFWGILMQKYYIKDTPKANFCKVIRCSRLRLWVGYCLF